MIERSRRLVERLAEAPIVTRWAPSIAWALMIWLLSSRTIGVDEGGVGLTFLFNGGHVAVYAIFAFLLHIALPSHGVQRFGFALGLAALYGLTDELHQSFVPGRVASVFDLCSDVSGAALGAAFATWLRERPVWALRTAVVAIPSGLVAVACDTFL